MNRAKSMKIPYELAMRLEHALYNLTEWNELTEEGVQVFAEYRELVLSKLEGLKKRDDYVAGRADRESRARAEG
jgi:homogentisate 1,2-dioxygenase